ncbi:helix-turn-helix domain-containing protein [Cryobacterium aureum]|uniref:helix-turn-helix domain-containing protein n=1 Tax=Cryobacterium aureum TaxID=995037 RepID=UPI000CF413FF|nr:helix-turn-helix domain-containing protein [Cryobacterium aureum]
MKQPRALTESERNVVLEVLRSERFVDKAPAEIQAILLDEGTYLCSVATMYRLLRTHGETGERRAQAEHPARVKPELIATGPNMTWSCYADIVIMPMLVSDASLRAVAGAKKSA